MSDQEQVQNEQVQDVNDKPEETPDIQELINKKLKEQEERYKKEIQGLNRKNSEYEKQLQLKELEKLEEDERLKKEIELARQEKERLENDNKRLARERVINNALFEVGLPSDFSGRIIGDDENSILNDVAQLNEYIKELAEKKAESIINERLGGKTPTAGAPADTSSLQSAYNDAIKSGKMDEAIAIKRQAHKEGVQIN